MADKPIIFSAPMVRALLAGTKTQTRRVLKPQPTLNEAGLWRYPPDSVCDGDPKKWVKRFGGFCQTDDDGLKSFLAPVGKRNFLPYAPGDRLYVREAWRVGAWRAEHFPRGDAECGAEVAIDYLADGFARREWLRGGDPDVMLRLLEQSRKDASGSGAQKDAAGVFHWEPGSSPCRWRPSIHMPRWASRITLTVTEVRVQRLQEITEADAVAEGAEVARGIHGLDGGVMVKTDSPYVFATPGCWYRELWNSLHGPDAWDTNPWVGAYSFTVRQGNIDA
jgi:hypothetical protein